jgi:hypothetical protein
MNRLTDPKFANIIKSLPIKDHTVVVPTGKILYLYDSNQKSELPISREDIFEERDPIKKLKQTLLWGYPTGIYKFVPALLGDDAELKDLGEKLSKWDTTKDQQAEVVCAEKLISLATGQNKFRNLGTVTLTKMAYFFRVDVEGNKALILDKRIIQAAEKWQELCKIGLSGGSFDSQQYAEYLKKMSEAARTIGCDADQIEFFLFTFGDSFG